MQSQPYNNLPLEPRQTSSKHGFPALLSFFLPGIGQIIKGHIVKGLSISISCIILFFLSFIGFNVAYNATVIDHDKEHYISIIVVSAIELLFFVILFFWNVYDAYNSNKRT